MPQTDAGRTLRELLAGQRGVFVHRAFIRRFGLATAAFLDQALYWTPRADDEDGWFYKRREEWADETGLSRHEQETARATLRTAGLLREERRGGVDRTVWFRLDLDAVADLLRQGAGGVADASANSDHWKGPERPLHRPDRAVVKGAQPTPQRTAEKGGRPADRESPTDPLSALWRAVLADLQEQMAPGNFARWLARTALVRCADGQAVVATPDRVGADQLARRFDPLVRRALADACGEAVAVRYEAGE